MELFKKGDGKISIVNITSEQQGVETIMPKKTITYKGKSLSTSVYEESPVEYYEELRRQYNTKPSKYQVEKNIRQIFLNDTISKTILNRYFLREVHDKVVINGCKWSIEDLFANKEIFDIYYAKIQRNQKVFYEDSEMHKIEKAIGLGGAGIVKSATYYPIDNVEYMIQKYCKPQGNYYDYSCGWGDRLIGAMKCNVNYYGTDPNYELIKCLENMDQFIRGIIPITKSTHLYAQGSEIHINELEGIIDFAFTSPPYFNLEDYKIGNQSYKEGTNYEDWLKDYLRPTIRNIYSYLKEDGYCAINIKNIPKYNLLDDSIRMFKECGFRHLGFEDLEVISRRKVSGELLDNNEKIAVFSKGIDLPREDIYEQCTLF